MTNQNSLNILTILSAVLGCVWDWVVILCLFCHTKGRPQIGWSSGDPPLWLVVSVSTCDQCNHTKIDILTLITLTCNTNSPGDMCQTSSAHTLLYNWNKNRWYDNNLYNVQCRFKSISNNCQRNTIIHPT